MTHDLEFAGTLILAFAAVAVFAAPAALAAESPDATTVIRYLAPKVGMYQIELEKTSAVGYINAFAWIPPSGLTVTAVTKTTGGSCGVVENEIRCRGANFGS